MGAVDHLPLPQSPHRIMSIARLTGLLDGSAVRVHSTHYEERMDLMQL